MNDTSFLSLVQNAVMLLAVAFIFDVAATRWRIEQSSLQQAIVGLALSAIGITVMLTPWTFGPGIVFDTRSVLISISGLFFGTVSTAILMAFTAGFRYYLGGAGAWTGVGVILVSGMIGIAWRHFHRRPLAKISWRELYIFGLVIHLAMLAMMFTLPWATALRVVSNIALPVMLIYPVGTALLGTLMINRLRLDQLHEDLREKEQQYRDVFVNHTAVKFFIDPDTGSIIEANEAAVNYYGWSHERLKRMNIQEINTLPPEDIKKELEKARTQKRTHFEFRHRRADGSIRDVEVFSSKIEVKGKDILHSIIHDITDRKRAEKALKDTLYSLRKALGTTIQVIVSAVESRDPYTAGHQIRVADLARAIATEMGLLQDRIEGIRMAGTIHDIGKLSIPAEILSKPTKLTDIEFSLIKEHARSGYEILKDVESPWPLAEIVYQHHERMDGSGYPRNLKGDEILMEARIMAVADVVESMASHRPYRPALGIEAALKEIARGKGVLYDPEVVDACLTLFKEKGYALAI